MTQLFYVIPKQEVCMKSYFNSLIFIVSLFTSYAVCAVDYDSQIQPIFTSHCTPVISAVRPEALIFQLTLMLWQEEEVV